jgi:hypothetical protein
MRTGTTVCGSDELKVLDQIVDSIADQLKRHERYSEVDQAKLRERISKQVFRQAGSDVLNVDAIKRRVLFAFEN